MTFTKDPSTHPAHGPLRVERLIRVRDELSTAAMRSEGGNLGYMMADAAKAIDELLSVRKAGEEPVLYAAEETLAYAKMGELHLKCLSRPMGEAVIPLYAAPQLPQPAVISDVRIQKAVAWLDGVINANPGMKEPVTCRSAMLQGKAEPVSQPELTVWYGSMPESNGKTNWTAILHRKGEGRCLDGFTIDRSEYPERVRYAADRVRFLIGELAEKPCILDYDADAHSGYAEPVSQPDTLREGLEAIRNSGIAIDAEKIQAERDAINTLDVPDGWAAVPVEPTEDMIIAGFEAELREEFRDPEAWEAFEAMSGCEQAALRAKWCWAAMITAAPQKEAE